MGGESKILIVDDELILRESLSRWLERDGHRVETAASGEEALDRFKETRYDILLVDIKMEGISGLEVLRHIKESDPDVAVVMITAYGSISTAIESIELGNQKERRGNQENCITTRQGNYTALSCAS